MTGISKSPVSRLCAELDADGMLPSGTAVLDGRTADLAEVTAACDTVPFLSAHRLVSREDDACFFNHFAG